MVNNSYSPRDILCLQYAGIKPSRIMTSGLDIVHPKENAPLQQRILEKVGLILVRTSFRSEGQSDKAYRPQQIAGGVIKYCYLGRMSTEKRQYAHHAFCPQIPQTLSRGFIS